MHIIRFLSNYFEILAYMTGAFIIMFLVLAVVTKFDDLDFKKVTLRFLNLFTLMFIIGGLLFLLVFIYWYNYLRVSDYAR